MPAATAPASSRRNWNGCRGTWQPLATSKMPLEQISRPAQGASMSTKLRTGISPAFSDAVVAELRAAINNNAPINETVFSSLLPSQKVAWSFEPVGKGLYVSTNAFGTVIRCKNCWPAAYDNFG